ncbi:hypothetical protein GQ43DRAFT_313007 [Delitschia confertaspora ATCC 74209]|uniref:Uncharacterized protein n=1 Tax=Delitschia confertaspora ATCC 74209 TaxID=1513339 RepID=A0A9P4JTL7_9PLEO|nr:hypothetical protein GQ43DRAFT_313007 [Delitschia confertaspora ATCC 74209]
MSNYYQAVNSCASLTLLFAVHDPTGMQCISTCSSSQDYRCFSCPPSEFSLNAIPVLDKTFLLAGEPAAWLKKKKGVENSKNSSHRAQASV